MGNELIADLRKVVRGDVAPGVAGEDDHDASHYRIVPRAVVRAASVEDLHAVVEVARAHATPITMRGGGTSLAGQAVGGGILLETKRLSSVSVDADERIATVGPGCTLNALNRAAAAYGLWFGPDVSSSSWATLGGMIGNDSCGARSLRYGRTSDHLDALELIGADGSAWSWKQGEVPPPVSSVVQELERERVAIEAAFTSLPRRVAGYGLDRLLQRPEDPGGFAGTEGTLAVLASARVRLEECPSKVEALAFVVRTRSEALELVLALRACTPESAEVIDDAILRLARVDAQFAERMSWVPADAGAIVFCEFFGEGAEGRRAQASKLGARVGAAVVPLDGAVRADAWALRKAGLPLLTRVSGLRRPVSLIEDLAVPPDAVPAFVTALEELIADAGTDAVMYAHAAAGCLHVRPRFDLGDDGERAAALALQREAVLLAVSVGGTSTGEHGDGRARSHLLPLVYSPEILRLFESVKRAFDPDGLLNPGIIVRPASVEDGLHAGDAGEGRIRTVLGSL